MPFTGNRVFKKNPRLVARAKGMFYYTPDGREILDMVAGLWCCNAGHGHPRIVEAIQAQAAEMDYAPHFGFGHPAAFEVADRNRGRTCDELPHQARDPPVRRRRGE